MIALAQTRRLRFHGPLAATPTNHSRRHASRETLLRLQIQLWSCTMMRQMAALRLGIFYLHCRGLLVFVRRRLRA